MWEETARLALTWLRITLALVVVLGVVLLVYGWGSAQFTVAGLLAAVVEMWAIRGLTREWSWLARGCWWWD
ncbi:MAG: hypothetical protein ACRDTE_08195 [Pseudonocardiaceae bacterium]